MANRIAMQWSVEEVVTRGIVTVIHLSRRFISTRFISTRFTIDMLIRLNRAIYSNRKSNSEQSYAKYVPNQQ